MDARTALQRYPRLVAHLICESLGYFTPLCAANAIVAYCEDRSFACEWYSSMCEHRGKGFFDTETLKAINKETLGRAFARRRRHQGYMASYPQALALVKAELQRAGATSGMLAAWF